MCERQLFQRYCCFCVLILLTLAACARNPQQGATAVLPSSLAHTPSPVPSPAALVRSVSRFTLRDAIHHGMSQRYTFVDPTHASKLRHGHKEFTIVLAQGQQSLIIAFIGYAGPGSYTLTNGVNGGDIRIAPGQQQYWDLSLDPQASCSLRILTDAPTAQSGVDTMTGSFSCPRLPAGPLNSSSAPVAVTDGTFDIAMLVES